MARASKHSSVLDSFLDWGVRVRAGSTSGLTLVALAKAPLSSAITLSSSMIGLSIDTLERKVGMLIRYVSGAHPGCHQPH